MYTHTDRYTSKYIFKDVSRSFHRDNYVEFLISRHLHTDRPVLMHKHLNKLLLRILSCYNSHASIVLSCFSCSVISCYANGQFNLQHLPAVFWHSRRKRKLCMNLHCICIVAFVLPSKALRFQCSAISLS